ncbi:MAG: hypothetical protein ACLGIG_06930 [Actinomycetes bacterium]
MSDDVLDALDRLCGAMDDARKTLDAMSARASVLRDGRAAGRSYTEIVTEGGHPLMVELLTTLLDEMSVAGSAFRRAEARALHDEGLSQETIAAHFGVTRQRVAALLTERRSAPR